MSVKAGGSRLKKREDLLLRLKFWILPDPSPALADEEPGNKQHNDHPTGEIV